MYFRKKVYKRPLEFILSKTGYHPKSCKHLYFLSSLLHAVILDISIDFRADFFRIHSLESPDLDPHQPALASTALLGLPYFAESKSIEPISQSQASAYRPSFAELPYVADLISKQGLWMTNFNETRFT